MILDLKSLFAQDRAVLPIVYELDLRAFEWMGETPLREPIRVVGSVENRASVVTLTLRCAVAYTAACDRCGTEATNRYEVPLTRTLTMQRAGVGDAADDLLELPDAQLDLDALCTEEIVLNLPRKHLCRADCRGLCPVCGRNRNTDPCHCVTDGGDERFAALRVLRDAADGNETGNC